MLKKINKIELREFSNLHDQKWYSYIKALIEKTDYGNLEIKMVIKKKEVMNIKVISEDNYNMHNN